MQKKRRKRTEGPPRVGRNKVSKSCSRAASQIENLRVFVRAEQVPGSRMYRENRIDYANTEGSEFLTGYRSPRMFKNTIDFQRRDRKGIFLPARPIEKQLTTRGGCKKRGSGCIDANAKSSRPKFLVNKAPGVIYLEPTKQFVPARLGNHELDVAAQSFARPAC